MEKQEYQARLNEALYDVKCLDSWRGEEQKFKQIYQEALAKELTWKLKQQ